MIFFSQHDQSSFAFFDVCGGKGKKGERRAGLVSWKNSPEVFASARKLGEVDKTSSPSEVLN